MVGSVLAAFNWGVAFLGSLTVLMLLLIIGKRSHFNPSNFVLSGIALSALLQALVQFALAQGSGESYKILLWLTAQRIASPAQVHWCYLSPCWCF